MKIHLKQVSAQGLHLDGDEDCPIHDLEAEGIRCAGPLHYNIDVGVAGSARIRRAHRAAWPRDGRPHAVYSRGPFAQPASASTLRHRWQSRLQGETIEAR